MWHHGQLINLPLLKVISSVLEKKNIKKNQSATMALHGRNSSTCAFKSHEPATFLVGANPSSFLSRSSESYEGCGSERIGSCLTGTSEKICLDLNKKPTVSASSPGSQNAAWCSPMEGEPQDRNEEAKAFCTAEKCLLSNWGCCTQVGIS